MSVRLSVLMNVFNRAELLRRALSSWLRQTEGDFELIVCDDGSTDDTPQIAERFAREAPFEVRYVRQEHRGHRRAAILNRGLRASRYEWILFTDCDSLAMPDLVARHRAAAQPDRLLCGGYVRLNREETEALRDDDVRSGRYEQLIESPDRRREIRRRHRAAQWQIFRRKSRRPHNMGLNYSAPREALVRINGYDEAFEGWGGADGDVRERLRMIGVHPVSLYDTAIVLHMWHPPETTKTKETIRRNRAWAGRRNLTVFCERGLVQADGAQAGDEG